MLSRLLALALLVIAPLARAEPLDLTNAKSDEAAVVMIAHFFESIGLDVVDKDEKQFGLKFGGYNMVIIPYYTKDDGCRLNAYISYSGRKQNLGDAKLLSLANEINRTYNFVSFCVDKDGDFCYTIPWSSTRSSTPRSSNAGSATSNTRPTPSAPITAKSCARSLSRRASKREGAKGMGTRG